MVDSKAMTGQTLRAAPDGRIGTLVQDRYRIVKKLGEGGMGVVYEGEHMLIHRKVAIKCLHLQLQSRHLNLLHPNHWRQSLKPNELPIAKTGPGNCWAPPGKSPSKDKTSM